MVDEREPFQFSARVSTTRTVEAEAVLLRDGIEIARGTRTFQPGSTALTFRDVVDRPGVSRYRLEISNSERDRVPENNVGEAAVRVEAPATILLVNGSGRPDNFSRALQSGKLRVDIVAPDALPRDLARLVAYRAVILENVPASSIGPAGLTLISQFATDLGGGLLLTGGPGSFGVGGYFKSVLEPHLPVSMEIKNEHRKLSLAMVVALDRSGSMAAPVGDGRTKMDLANIGTCAAIDTLGPFDEVGVVAVDSAPHVVTPLTSAGEKDAICERVRTIQSLGGGIFTYTALVTAATMVQESSKGTRHIVLFADAADAEEPGEYERLLARIRPLGISVSVIGLGEESDSDAEFLKDVAARGGGRVQFTRNVEELPRLFAQEAITVARSSFISDATAARALPDMVLLGDLPATSFPVLDGYNLTYLRPGATMGVVTTDEYEAPVLAFWHRGLGRVASVTAEMDGEYSQRLNAWRGFSAFSLGLGRWLLGGEPPIGVQATMERKSGEGIVRVDLDPDRVRGSADELRAATAMIVVPDGRGGGSSRRLDLSWVGEDTLEARFPIERAGTYFGAVRTGAGHVLALAPLSLPYSPEYEPRMDPDEGRTALVEMARMTGGVERTAWDGVFSAGRLRDRQVRDLVLPLALLLLLLQMFEIAGRRLMLFDAAGAWLGRMRAARPVWRVRGNRPVENGGPSSGIPHVQLPAANETVPKKSAESALARAKARARDRFVR
jgi:uncharacterized membrane protein